MPRSGPSRRRSTRKPLLSRRLLLLGLALVRCDLDEGTGGRHRDSRRAVSCVVWRSSLPIFARHTSASHTSSRSCGAHLTPHTGNSTWRRLRCATPSVYPPKESVIPQENKRAKSLPRSQESAKEAGCRGECAFSDSPGSPPKNR